MKLLAGEINKNQRSQDSNGTGEEPKSTTTPARTTPTTEQLTAKLDSFKKQFQFEQAAAFLEDEGKPIQDSANLAQTYRDLTEMKRWIDGEVNMATASNKIQMTMTMNGSPTELSIFRDPSGAGYTVMMPTGEQSVVQFTQLGDAGIAALATSLIAHPIGQSEPKAQGWLTEFQQQYPSVGG
jgi:hypothetical protein